MSDDDIIDLAEIRNRDALPPQFSEDALALRFAALHERDLRYVAAWGKWLSYDRTRWCTDTTCHAFDLVRHVCRDAAVDARKDRTKFLLSSAKTVAAVERLAKSDRRLAATADQWDGDPWLLNTPRGVVDLRTGSVRQHRPDDYITKITALEPGGECPTWMRFLERVLDGDTELIGFLQRVLGYCLTGDTSAHALFFLYGTGANGKSVFINTVSGILGDYHRTAPIETFTASNVDRHPTELAGLRGSRLVTAVETEEGRRWAESRIKSLTGGDPVAARFMRQDYFEYMPQFKLVIAGNHKPGLRSVDEAIRRRFHLIPFTVTIPEEERDETLTDRLKDEWPGVLQWMIDGCIEWQERGLRPPEAVRAATETYLAAQDAVSAWAEECCEPDPDGFETQKDLFGSWSKWAAANGEFVGTRPRFNDALAMRGFQEHRRKYGRGFLGFKLKRDTEADEWWNR